MKRGRVIPGNLRRVVGLAAVPDRQSIQIASLGIATNTNSPMSAGIGLRAYGDSGYGVNRAAGDYGPRQAFTGIPSPIAYPGKYNVGMQAGPSDQPGYPSTGQTTGSTGWLDLAKQNNLGWS